MTFQQLQYLLAIQEAGSVSQAAKDLFVSQSSMSIALAALETELGCRIFIRSTQGLTLTPEGKEVIGHARRICESHRLLTSSVKPSRPQLRIGAIEYAPARRAFLRLLSENRDRTDIRFILHDARNKNFDEELLAGRMDVAVAMFTNAAVRRQEENLKKKGFYYEKLLTLPAAVCIGPGHRLYNVPDFPMEELKNE